MWSIFFLFLFSQLVMVYGALKMPSVSSVLKVKECVNATTVSSATHGLVALALPSMNVLSVALARLVKSACKAIVSIDVIVAIVASVPSVMQHQTIVSANLSTSVILMFFVFRVSALIQTKNQVNLLTLSSIFLFKHPLFL